MNGFGNSGKNSTPGVDRGDGSMTNWKSSWHPIATGDRHIEVKYVGDMCVGGWFMINLGVSGAVV